MSTLKRVLAISLALMMALSVGVFGIEFKDQEDITAENMEAIEILVALDVLHKDGKGGGVFAPNDNVTRAEAAKMLYVLLNKGVDDKAVNYVGPKTFGDVATGHWAEGYIEYCFNMGIVAGKGVDAKTGKRIFAPDAPVTGYEWAKMLLVAGNYQSVVRGYENNASWKQNIARDAMNSGLTEGYAQPLDSASLRQWAARMMAALVVKVEYAQYIGDLLITGTGVVKNGKTVGEQLLGLTSFEGTLTQTKTVGLLNGPSSTGYAESVVIGGLGVGNVGLNYDADADLLGQTVTVVAKKVNTAVGLTNKNLKVLSVYSANETIVHDLALSSITFAKVRNTEDNANVGVSIKFAGFNGGKAVSYTGLAADQGVQAFNELFFGNNYKALAPIATVSSDGIDTAFTGSLLGRKGNDAVRVLEENGEITAIFFKETSYQRINSVNTTRVVTNRASLNVADVNIIGAEPVKGDIVAVTERFETGKKTYDVRVIEAVEGVKVTKWTGDAADAATVTIDGTSYSKATGAADFTLNRAHSVYYLDGKVAVASAAAKDDNTSTLNSKIAIVTGKTDHVAEAPDSLGNPGVWGFKVQYMGLDGKVSGVKSYSLTTAQSNNEANAQAVWDTVDGLDNGFVLVTENSNGTVTFESTGVAASCADAAYVRSTGKLTATLMTPVYVVDDTQVFIKYGTSYKLIAGKDLYAFASTDHYTVEGYVINPNTGDALAVYLTGAAVPTDGTVNYAVVTGSAGFNTLGLDDKTAVQGKAVLGKDGAFDMLVDDATTLLRWNVYTYTVGTVKHTATQVKQGDGVLGYISAMDVDKGFFMLNGATRYTFDEKTVVIEVGGSAATVLNTPYVTGAAGDPTHDVLVIANSDGLAKLIVINSDGAAVSGTNVSSAS